MRVKNGKERLKRLCTHVFPEVRRCHGDHKNSSLPFPRTCLSDCSEQEGFRSRCFLNLHGVYTRLSGEKTRAGCLGFAHIEITESMFSVCWAERDSVGLD